MDATHERLMSALSPGKAKRKLVLKKTYVIIPVKILCCVTRITKSTGPSLNAITRYPG